MDLSVLLEKVQEALGEKLVEGKIAINELTLCVRSHDFLEIARFLHDSPLTLCTQLTDLCAVDYLAYGESEWDVTGGGFSRGVKRDFSFDGEDELDESEEFDGPRYAVVIHALSIPNNLRVRLKTFCDDNDFPTIDSVTSVWSSANWFEREAFDLFGILFNGHPDLRRILTDYGFIGHPFRKDFPLIGQVEMRYDEAQGRVVYEPVSIDPRTLVPRVIRAADTADTADADAVTETDVETEEASDSGAEVENDA